MKRRSAWLLLAMVLLTALVLVLNLSACAEKMQTDTNAPYSVEYDHTLYTVTPADDTTGTIFDGTETYSYQYEPRIGGYRVKFTYPDGETYTWTDDGGSMSGTTSPGFDFEKYPDGMTLQRVLEQSPSAKREKKSTKNVGLILALLFVGGINTAFPQAAWYLETGWKIKDAEPSDAALMWNRVGGVVALIIAAIMMIA